MTKLRPFFSFYGAKWRLAPKYPRPEHDTIVEPFAGAAGYSTRHADRNVILIERDPVIAALWRYLIGVSESEVRSLPLITREDWIPDLPVCAEARSLIGFWSNGGSATPKNMLSKWGVNNPNYWSEKLRERVASQLHAIRHWRVIEGDYSCAPDVEATWFIDPPYQNAGKHYKYPSGLIDFAHLGAWCRTRQGTRIVCENAGADWLPFEPFCVQVGADASGGGRKISTEAIFVDRS